MLNSKGPKTDPCGTPESTAKGDDNNNNNNNNNGIIVGYVTKTHQITYSYLLLLFGVGCSRFLSY
jgi:hypothetical protein